MKKLLGVASCLVAIATGSLLLAQPPGAADSDGSGRPGGPPPRDGRRGGPPVIAALDTDKDGELSSDEIKAASDSLMKLDHNKDGKLDGPELGPPPPPRGEGGPRDRGPRGREGAGERRGPREGGPRGGGPGDGPPRGPRGDGPPDHGPGAHRGLPPSVLPPHMADELKLSDDQLKQLKSLDEEVVSRLEKILTSEQRDKLKDMGPPPPPERRGPPPRDRRGPGDEEEDERGEEEDHERPGRLAVANVMQGPAVRLPRAYRTAGVFSSGRHRSHS